MRARQGGGACVTIEHRHHTSLPAGGNRGGRCGGLYWPRDDPWRGVTLRWKICMTQRNFAVVLVRVSSLPLNATTWDIAMRTFLTASVALLLLCGPALADDTKHIPQDVLDQLQKDLQKLRPEQPPSETPEPMLAFKVIKPDVLAYPVPDPTSTATHKFGTGDSFKVLAAKKGWVGVQFQAKTLWMMADEGDLTKSISDPLGVQSWWDEQVARLLKQAADLKAKWDKNPYVSVKGFSLDVGLDPSITIEFEFKEFK
jgi:hypothetical protein